MPWNPTKPNTHTYIHTYIHTYTHTHIYIYMYIYIYEVHTRFQTFFVWAFKIVVDCWEFSMLCLFLLWDDWPVLMISASNEQLQQQLEVTLLKPDCHSWWILKMVFDTLEERYAIKFCFKLGKMPQKRMECFRLLFDHLAWIEYQFLSDIRDSRKVRSLWGVMRGVGGGRRSIHQSWLAKRLGLLCWRFKGVQEEIPSEEASTLQIVSVAFTPGQLVTDYLTKMSIKTLPQPPYSPDLAPCDFCLFPKLRRCCYETIEEIKEAVTKVIDTFTQEYFHGAFQKLLERLNKCIAAGGDFFEGD